MLETSKRSIKMFLILSAVTISQFWAGDVCLASPLTPENSPYAQLAVQEKIAGLDSFYALLDIKADRISFAIKVVKCLTAYLAIAITLLTLYFNSVYKRMDEGEDGFEPN